MFLWLVFPIFVLSLLKKFKSVFEHVFRSLSQKFHNCCNHPAPISPRVNILPKNQKEEEEEEEEGESKNDKVKTVLESPEMSQMENYLKVS